MWDLGSRSYSYKLGDGNATLSNTLIATFTLESEAESTQDIYARTLDPKKLRDNKLCSLRLNLSLFVMQQQITDTVLFTTYISVLSFYILIVLAMEKGMENYPTFYGFLYFSS